MHCDRETYLVNSTLVGHTGRAGTDLRTERTAATSSPSLVSSPATKDGRGKGVEQNYIRRSAPGVLSPLPAFHQTSGSARVTHRTMNGGGMTERAASIQPPSINLDLVGSTMRKTMRTPTRRGAKGSSTPQDCRSGWARGRIAKPRLAYGKAPHSAPDTLLALSPPSTGQDKGRKEKGVKRELTPPRVTQWGPRSTTPSVMHRGGELICQKKRQGPGEHGGRYWHQRAIQGKPPVTTIRPYDWAGERRNRLAGFT